MSPDNQAEFVGITSEQVIVQASSGHELVHQNPVISNEAVSNKFNQVWMTK